MSEYKNPSPAVDAVIFHRDMQHIIVIERKNPPAGWALPGGFVDEGESLEQAIKREIKEELGIDVFLLEQFYTYSDPQRDPRKHVMSTVFLATTTQNPRPDDDALSCKVVSVMSVLSTYGCLCFDHERIVRDAHRYLTTGERRKLD